MHRNVMSKKLGKVRYFLRFLLLIVLAYHFFWESSPALSVENENLYQLLDMQRQVDRYGNLSDNNLQGTHNSYNSDVYHTLFRYHDRQQHLSIYEQLEYGARFIELDIHWTFSAWEMRQDLLLCHGSDKFNVFPFHWGCSPFDKPLTEALEEVSTWLKDPKNKDELLLFYIEDHSDGRHEYLYNLLAQYEITSSVFASGGCKEIPDTLSKNDLIEKGKQVVFWKDGECSEFSPLASLAFSDLGNLLRHAEDRTTIGTIEKRYVRGINPRIEKQDVITSFKQGANIVNFDNFIVNDERMQAVLWSWDFVDSDINMTQMNNGCVQQKANGRWQIRDCEEPSLKAACFNRELKKWSLTDTSVVWKSANKSCQQQPGFVFSAPTNYLENQTLSALSEHNVWLNIQKYEQSIVVGDKRK